MTANTSEASVPAPLELEELLLDEEEEELLEDDELLLEADELLLEEDELLLEDELLVEVLPPQAIRLATIVAR